jgi:hypothetical protein
MSKIALCLTGYAASTEKVIHEGLQENKAVISLAYRQLKKHILTHNDVDIYIHTWSTPLIEEFIRVFQPVKYLHETQPNFTREFDPVFITEIEQQALYARSYAIEQVLKLCLSSDTSYSHVLLTRPDLYWLSDINISNLDSELIHISDFRVFHDRNDKKIPEVKFYRLFTEKSIKSFIGGYPLQKTVNDLIFLMNMDHARLFQNIFKNITLYAKNFQDRRCRYRLNAHRFFYEHLEHNYEVTKKLVSTFQHTIDFTLTRHFIKSQRKLGLQYE